MKSFVLATVLIALTLSAAGQSVKRSTRISAASANTLRYIPSSGVFRILMLYTEFPDDTVSPGDARWPIGKGPYFLKTIIDSTVEQRSGHWNNLTTYFRDMSQGRLSIIGTTRYMRAPKPLSAYPSWNGDSAVVGDLLRELDQTFDFAPFDNYSPQLNAEPIAKPDSAIDLLIVVYRRPYKFLGAWSMTPVDIERVMLDNGARYFTGSHIVICVGNYFPERFPLYLLETGYFLANNIRGSSEPGIWSIFGWFEAVSPMMNGLERSDVGWGSMIDISSDTTIALPDFARTGVWASVKISTSSGSSKHYYLENHQGHRSPYLTAKGDDSTYDRVDEAHGARPGLYILKERNGYVRVVCADGAWDWKSPDGIPAVWSAGQRLPIFERNSVNRINGFTDRMALQFYDPQHNGTNTEAIYAWRDRNTREVFNTRTGLYRGDGHDAWRPDENNIFSIWSNPSTAWMMYDDSVASQLSIHVLEQRGDTIIVRVSYHDPVSLPPSQPQDLHIDFNTPDRTITTLRWEPNIEPDVFDSLAPERSPGVYELWRQVERADGFILQDWKPIATFSAADELVYRDAEFANGLLRRGDDHPIPPIIRYHVRVRDRDGLWSMFSAPVEIAPNEAQLQLAHAGERCFVFPNPASEDAQLFYTVTKAGPVRITMTNVAGQIMMTLVDGYREEGNYVTSMSVGNVASGSCFVFVETPEFRQSVPVFVVR